MVSSTAVLAFTAGAAAQAYYGGDDSWSSSAAAATTTYACNPAHQYPSGVSCATVSGSLALVTASSTAAAATTTYACNPAHQYPAGQACTEISGSLTLVTASPTAAATTTYACNPAHQYPAGQTCTEISGSLTLVTASATPSSKASCDSAYDACRTAPDANFSYCASLYAQCLGYNPFTQGVSSTVSSKAASPSASSLSCQQKDNACRTAPDANFSYCASENAKCESSCQSLRSQCQSKPDPNESYCAAIYASCLGYNPFTQSATSTATTPDTYVTQVVTAYTTYCPQATTFAHGNKTYTVTSATTLTITDCPGGCRITTPVKSLPPATTVTAVVTSYTTDCPTPTVVTIQSKTYSVTSSTVITVQCPGGCTVTTPVSMLPPAPPASMLPPPPVVAPSASAGVTTVRAPSAPSAPSGTAASATAKYTGAAEKVVGSGALMVGALALFAL